MQVSGQIDFDSRGRIAAQGQPVFDNGPTASFVTVPVKNATSFEYDILGRTRKALYPDEASTQVDFAFASLDGVSRFLTSRKDAEGRVTKTFLDTTGSVRGIEQTNTIRGAAKTLVTRYEYNPLSELTSVRDAAGNVTWIELDTLGRRIVIDNPDAGRTELRYDPAGNLGAKITANLAARGQQIRFHRHYHRLTRISYPEKVDTLFTYGEPGAPFNRADRVATVSDESGLEERFYGEIGEIVQTIKTATALNGYSPKGPYSTSFEYDSFNRLLALTYPDGEELAFTFDAGGQVQSAAGTLAGTRSVYVAHLSYDEFGQKARIVYGNGVESRFSYDPQMRRLVQLQSQDRGGSEFQDLRLSYNKVGSILAMENDVAVPHPSAFGGPVVQTFRYDDLYQVTGADGEHRFARNKRSTYTFAASYDETGNILSKSQLHQIVQPSGKPIDQRKTSYDWTYDYDGAQPHAATHFGERTFHYDLNGNQTGWEHDRNGTRRTQTWDEDNRLKAVADNGATTRFLYNSGGQRSNKAGPHGETIYINPFFSVRNGAIGSKHVFVDGTRIATQIVEPALETPSLLGDKLYFYHGNQTGSSHFVTDGYGELFQHLEYFPFGDLWIDERTESERTPYLFSGKELDDETGLYYFGFRYMGPRQGQWLSADPILDEMLDIEALGRPDLSASPFRLSGLPYAYAGNDPINLVDPTGLAKENSKVEQRSNKIKNDLKTRLHKKHRNKLRNTDFKGIANRIRSAQALQKKVNAEQNVGVGLYGAIIELLISGKEERSGALNAPQKRKFKVKKGPRPLNNHTEVKFIETVALKATATSEGQVVIYTERTPCRSCIGVILRFRKRFPGVKVRTISDQADKEGRLEIDF